MNTATKITNRKKILIVNYGTGNLHSVKKAFDKMNVESVISDDPSDIENCGKIVLPGVGHFAQAMKSLKESGLMAALETAVLEEKKSVLGICLGMQLFAKKSEEGNAEGLGWFDTEAVKFQIKDKLRHKIPHTGWNRVSVNKDSRLFCGIEDLSEFYFVHGFHLKLAENVAGWTYYEYDFPSVIEQENIFGVQFHPEKSRDAGFKLLENFVNL